MDNRSRTPFYTIKLNFFANSIMTYSEKPIPYYSETNDLLSALDLDGRTTNPFFYCLHLKSGDKEIYKPPFKRAFYFLALLNKAHKTEVSYDDVKNKRA